MLIIYTVIFTLYCISKLLEVISISENDLLQKTLDALALLNKSKPLKNTISTLTGETFLLSRLNELGGQITPSKLAKYTDFTPARLSAILKTLQNKNFVQKSGNEADKRSIKVKITPEGKNHIESRINEINEHTSYIINKLGYNDTNEFVRLIHKIIIIEQEAHGNFNT